MRILRVAQKTYPDVTGGGAYHVHAMSRDQVSMGHNVTVLTVGEGPRLEERGGYSVVRLPASISILGNDISASVAKFIRCADGFDVIHAHSHLYFSTNVAAFNRIFDHTPLAITNHGLYSQTAPKWLFDAYLQTAGKWTFNASDTVFCYTNEDRRRLQERGITAHIEVVHNGIDTSRFTPQGEAHEGIIGDPALLFVGRLVEGKRPDDALAAFASVHDVYPEAGLNFCGTGPLLTDLKQQAERLDVDDAVQFLGHVAYNAMPGVYRGGDLLILPSRSEGLPRTILEALATGCPVVTSDLPQLKPIVNKAGETVAVGDTEALAASLRELLDDESRRQRLGDRGREHVVECYAWEETVEQTTAQLDQIANQ